MTSNPQPKPNQSPIFPQPSQRKSPLAYVRIIGDHVKAAIVLMFWAIVAAVSIAVTVLAFKTIYWASQLILQSLGVR